MKMSSHQSYHRKQLLKQDGLTDVDELQPELVSNKTDHSRTLKHRGKR